MSGCPLAGGSPSKRRVFISLEHMADAQDSEVKCYKLRLDSLTATNSLVSTCNLQTTAMEIVEALLDRVNLATLLLVKLIDYFFKLLANGKLFAGGGKKK